MHGDDFDRDDFHRLLRDLPAGELGRGSAELSLFCALKGHLAKGELMIVGRAVNGWKVRLTPGEARSDSDLARESLVSELMSTRTSATCPMTWVTQHWENSTEYRTQRSAFWRTARAIVSDLRIADVRSNWPSALIWSNLYKVAPHAGGNPDSKLCAAQVEICRAILQSELATWRPRRVVFFTGLDWAFPFLGTLERARFSDHPNALVPLQAILRVDDCEPIKIAVAQHPQTRLEARFVQEVVRACS